MDINRGLEGLQQESREQRTSLARVERAIDWLVNYEDRYKLEDGRNIESVEENSEATEASDNADSEDSYIIRDRYHNMIYIGDKIKFLTRGRFKSKTRIVYKISRNKERITAKDPSGNSITRHPSNIDVISKDKKDEHCWSCRRYADSRSEYTIWWRKRK